MLVVLSPAKTLDYTSSIPAIKPTTPRLLEYSQHLVNRARQLSAEDLQKLMKVSAKIAELNVTRFHDWHLPFDQSNARSAIFAFKGDTYTGLDVARFSHKDLLGAQQHLRMLSGLYGVLRPFDLMQPYRLEMGTQLDTKQGKNLYAFWGDVISQCLLEDMQKANTDILVNLASKEYFKSVNPRLLPQAPIEPVFEDEKHGTYKVISFYAKKARGSMAAWIVKNQITRIADLQAFNADGYAFHAPSSSASRPVFRRAEA